MSNRKNKALANFSFFVNSEGKVSNMN